MGTRLPTGMAMLYAVKPNDRDIPDHLIKPKIPPEPLEQGGTGGIFAVIQLQFLAGEIKLVCSQSES